jgi:hypothetical protein
VIGKRETTYKHRSADLEQHDSVFPDAITGTLRNAEVLQRMDGDVIAESNRARARL